MKWIIYFLVFFCILLTLISVVHADTYESNYYSSYDGPDEGFFSGIIGDILGTIELIPTLFLKAILKISYAGANFAISIIVKLLTEPAPIDAFYHLWKVVVFVLSTTFVLVLTFCGVYLMISGENPEKRAKSKEWIKYCLIMLVVVPISFFIYQFIVEFSAGLTNAIMSYVSTEFLYIGEGNLSNLALELPFGLFYSLASFITLFLLVMRLALVCAGTLFFPIGLMLYFIPPTREYGLLLLNFILVNIFSTFFIALFLATFSLMSSSGILSSTQILLATSCLFIVNLFLIYIMFFAALKALFKGVKTIVSVVATAQFFGL